jgi:nucleotide-binding universal stress UspA family protein
LRTGLTARIPLGRPEATMTRARPKQILVPTDFSDAANEARGYALMLGDVLGARLHILHVMPDPLVMGWGVDKAHLPQMLERTERNVREQIDAMLTAEERAKFKVQVSVETGSPAAKILEYAAAHHIDLIVMGTTGRGALERMWVGSVTQRVLQDAACPVVSLQQPRR